MPSSISAFFPALDPALLWNTLFDKGLLTAGILLLGYFANRWLERYRFEMALATEGAKLRLDRIGRLWEEMSAWEADVKGLFVEFASVSIDELTRAGLIPHLDGNAKSIYTILAISQVKIPAELEDRIAARVMPNKDAHVAHGIALWREIDRHRFWLREELFSAMKRYHLAVQKAEAALAFTPEAIQAGTKALDDLDSLRQDVDAAIDHILSRSRNHKASRVIAST